MIVACLPLICNAQKFNIDLTKAVSKDMPMSDLFDEIHEVVIKIPANSEVSDRRVFMTNDEKRFVVAGLLQGLMLFDGKGNFLKKIVTPDSEYMEKGEVTSVNAFLDGERGIFYRDAYAYGYWIGIDIETGKIVRRIHKPSEFEDNLSDFREIGQNRYLSYVNNQTGTEKTLFVVFDEDGKILYEESNPNQYVKALADKPYLYGDFYKYNSEFYCREPYGASTTVYEVGKDHFTPYINFELGDRMPVYEWVELQRIDGNQDNKSWNINHALETKQRIYFIYTSARISHLGYYDKKSKRTYIATKSSKDYYSIPFSKDGFFPSFTGSAKTVTSRNGDKEIKVIIGNLK